MKRKLSFCFVAFIYWGIHHSTSAQTLSAGSLQSPILVLAQDKFIAGDTAWFKLYLLNTNNERNSGKNWIRVDIIDNLGASRTNSILAVENGLGAGWIIVPVDLQPGNYLITASQNEIENLKPAISASQIVVVNSDFLTSTTTKISSGKGQTKISIATDPIKTRDCVPVQIYLYDSLQRPVSGEFSVSVKHASLLGLNQDQERIKDVRMVLRNSTGQITSKSSSRIWEGTAYNAISKERLRDSTVFYVYLQKSGWRYQTVIGKEGQIRLQIPDLEMEDEFFYLAEIDDVITSKVDVDWKTPAFGWPSATTQLPGNAVDEYAIYAEKKKLVDRSYGFYSNRDSTQIYDGRPELTVDQFPISNTVKISEYELFTTMAEYIKEVVPSAYVRKRGGNNILRIKLQPIAPNLPPELATSDPIYFIDGIATHNTDFFLSLRPSELISIKIANDARKLRSFGLLGKNGVVIITTKNGHLREAEPTTNRILSGVQKPVAFQHIYHNSHDDKRKPDFRAILFWDPSVTADKNGLAEFEFCTSDDIGKYVVEVIGFSDDGKFFSDQAFFEVHPD